MTTQTATSAVPFGAITVYKLVTKFDGIRASIQTWNTRRVTTNALNRLSSAQLNDIGVTFKDIRRFPLEAGKF